MQIARSDTVEAKIKTYPDLSACCLRERLDLPLRLWYLLRQGCPDGRGWLTLDDVYHLSCGSRRQTRAWLRKGEGLFWTRNGGRLYLTGLEKVALALDAAPVRKPVYVALPDVESLGRFRAALFASWFADKPRTISQGRLGEIFGRTPRTLCNWAKRAALEVSHNLAWTPLPDAGADLNKYPDGTLEALTGGAVKTWMDNPDDRLNNVWIEHWDALLGERNWRGQNYRRGGTAVLV